MRSALRPVCLPFFSVSKNAKIANRPFLVIPVILGGGSEEHFVGLRARDEIKLAKNTRKEKNGVAPVARQSWFLLPYVLFIFAARKSFL